jgi:hypothetical protein
VVRSDSRWSAAILVVRDARVFVIVWATDGLAAAVLVHFEARQVAARPATARMSQRPVPVTSSRYRVVARPVATSGKALERRSTPTDGGGEGRRERCRRDHADGQLLATRIGPRTEPPPMP